MTSTLSASAERELERRAKHKLTVLRHVEEVSGNVAATCRHYGISRQAYYAWLKRYESEGFEGLKDRSSAPHHSPTATNAEVIEKILWLRQQYHFGPQKITMYLKRHHDIAISPSGVWRILKKLGALQGMEHEEPPDESTIRVRAQEGVEAAFATIFDLHKDRVFRHAFRLLGNRHDAEDALGVVFFELWRRRGEVRIVANSVLPWLLVTTSNVAFKSQRAQRGYQKLLDKLPRSFTPDRRHPQRVEQHDDYFRRSTCRAPPLFAALMEQHLTDRSRARTRTSVHSPWLFPVGKPGHHITHSYLLTQIRELGLNPLATRNRALDDLVTRAAGRK